MSHTWPSPHLFYVDRNRMLVDLNSADGAFSTRRQGFYTPGDHNVPHDDTKRREQVSLNGPLPVYSRDAGYAADFSTFHSWIACFTFAIISGENSVIPCASRAWTAAPSTINSSVWATYFHWHCMPMS